MNVGQLSRQPIADVQEDTAWQLSKKKKMNKRMRGLLLVCVRLFALTMQATDDSLSDSPGALDAERALEAGDYVKAAKLLRPLAEQGLAQAQLNLGLLYANGNGVPQDYIEAAKWYRLAAEQGHAKAQLNLSVMYGNGQGVARDDARAYMWAYIAAENEASSEVQNLSAAIQTLYCEADECTPISRCAGTRQEMHRK